MMGAMEEAVLDRLIDVLREKEQALENKLKISEQLQIQYKDRIFRLEAKLHEREAGDKLIAHLFACAFDYVDARGSKESVDRKRALQEAIKAAEPHVDTIPF